MISYQFTNITKRFLQCIDVSNAAGIDKISGRFLKDGANILAKPIGKICNISISSGFFSSDCKIAKLKALYKKRSKTDHENFRPTSFLPLISKVIERIPSIQSGRYFFTRK